MALTINGLTSFKGALKIRRFFPPLDISNSVIFNDGDNAYMSRTAGVPTGNQRIWTLSLWMKLGVDSSIERAIYQGHSGTSAGVYIRLTNSNTISIFDFNSVSSDWSVSSLNVLRDTTAWYHLVVSCDTTQPTPSDRIKIYINGDEVEYGSASYPSLNASTRMNINGFNQYLGIENNNGLRVPFDGYFSNVYFIDGQQLDANSFGTYDNQNEVWVPITYSGGSYGNNGFFLDFSDENNLGNDVSGNSNNLSVFNISSSDQVTDTPSNNFPTVNYLDSDGTYLDGNLVWYGPVGWRHNKITKLPNSGQWSIQYTVIGNRFSTATNAPYRWIGLANENFDFTGNANINSNPSGYYGYGDHGYYVENASQIFDAGSDWFDGDVLELLYDADAGTLNLKKNGILQTELTVPNDEYFLTLTTFDSSRYGRLDCGQKGFSATSGFLYPSYTNLRNVFGYGINKPSKFFDAITYIGNGSTQSIDNLKFSPDIVWVFNRDSSSNNIIVDSTRGSSNILESNTTSSEVTDSTTINSLNSNGFTVGSSSTVNSSSTDYIAYCFKEDNTKGIDIVSYTGSGSVQTINHGLTQTPEMIMVKNRDANWGWFTYHKDTDETTPESYRLQLESTGARIFSQWMDDTAPTSSVFTVGNGSIFPEVNASGNNYISYLFTSIPGFIKVGYYIGNGSTDGEYVYCGFRPKFILWKNTVSGSQWIIHDTARKEYNPSNLSSRANTTGPEDTSGREIDILSNGFKLRSTGTDSNASGSRYVFLAISGDSQLKLSR